MGLRHFTLFCGVYGGVVYFPAIRRYGDTAIRRYGGFVGLSPSAIGRDLRPIAAIAISAMLANVATPIGGAYVTRAMAEFGDAAVAGMAIIGRVTPIAFALIFAMSGAIGPIIGQNFGAGKHNRVRTSFNSSMVLIVVYVFPVVLVLYLLRPPPPLQTCSAQRGVRAI